MLTARGFSECRKCRTCSSWASKCTAFGNTGVEGRDNGRRRRAAFLRDGRTTSPDFLRTIGGNSIPSSGGVVEELCSPSLVVESYRVLSVTRGGRLSVAEMAVLLRYRWSGEPGGEAVLCWGRFSRMASRNSLRFGRLRLLSGGLCGVSVSSSTSSSSLELLLVSELVLGTGDGRLGVGRSCAKAVTGMGTRGGEVGPLLLRWWFVGRWR